MEPVSSASERRDSITGEPIRETRRGALATVLIVAAACGAAAFGTCAAGAHAPERCDALFQRYVDLSIQQADEKSKPWERQDKVATARTKAEALDALHECAENLTETQANCAEKASNPNEIEQCF